MSASAGASTLSGEQAKTNSVEASAGGGSGASSAPPLPVNRREFRRASEGGITSTDYGIEGILGEGGMGVVYRSRQSSLARSVAIKMVRPDLEVTPEISSSLISEAVLTGFLEHPNIVPVYDLAADQDGKLFYSMLQVQGTPWQDVITQKSELENLEILLRVSDAVAFAHSRGVIHRDLKPENVVLGQYGEVRVLDWGVAFMTPDCPQQQVITNSTRLQCTPSYAAPELLIGPATRIGPASDVYLLGAILYQIVTGTTPHTGGDLGECLQNVVTNTIHPTETTGELVEIALRAMQTEPEDRYRSARSSVRRCGCTFRTMKAC